MRRAYITLMMVIIGILVMASAGSSLAANRQGDQAALSGSVATAAKGVPDGTTKSPPPGDTGKSGPTDPNYRPSACLEPVVNVSATTGNHAESHIVINPTNPNNLVAFSNITSNSTFRGYSTDGGATWTRGNILPGIACCDAQAVFDRFGNLFMVYINGSVNQINVIASTDGGVTFSAPLTVGSGSIDQPSIAVGNGSVWVDWNQSGSMRVRGAPITGLGVWGPFNAVQTPPGATGSFGGIAVGPNDVPIIVYQNPTSGEGPATIFANVDTDGLGAGNFGSQINVTSTNVGGFDFIPAQSGRSIDAEAGVVWDYTGGTFNGRIYLVYTEEPVNENNDTEIYVRTSTNSGTTWSAPVRVNDDPTGVIRSQFLPYITLDRSSGTVAVGFHDSRNDNGVPGSGGTNAVVNDDSEYYATYTTDGGATWATNKRLSGGFSNDNAAGNGVDYGDYVGQDAYGGKFVGMWADNANCDGTNPDGTLHQFDLYMGVMQIPGGGTPTPTVTGTPPTNTPTATRTSTPVPTNTPVPTATPCAIVLSEGFESGTLGGFTNVVPTCVPGGCNWTSVASNPHSGTRSAFAPDGGNISDQYLEQTTGIVVSAGSTLTFWHSYDTEATFDGGVLEATTNNGTTWTDMEPNITSGGYDGPISTSFGSPIAGRNAWNGSHTAYSQVVVNLAPYVGQSLRIRFRLATDSSVSAVGWNVDDVTFLGGTCTTVTPATATATNTLVPPTVTPTNTPGTPSSTSTNTPTNTPTGLVPSPTSTNTPVGGTGTATNTPTSGPSATATETGTALPPTATATACTLTFSDVPVGSTFYSWIRCLACMGIVNGYPDGTFRPNSDVTRGQLSKIVSNSAGFTDPAVTQLYEDVAPGSTFYDFIYRLSIRGYINGYPCGGPGEPCGSGNLPYFRPQSSASRGQISKIVSNAAGYSDPAGAQMFEDVLPGSTFYDFIERLASRGFITGYPCGGIGEPCGSGNLPYFRPSAHATRGQTSKIVANTFFPGCDPAR